MRVLYLSYTGLMEPLGQSQVLAYLSRLCREHRITVITFEKPHDLADRSGMTALSARCDELGIRWLPQRYHHRPRLPATVWDILWLVWLTWSLCRRDNIQIVHCRSYIPAIVAWILKPVTRTPFIFDMRALWLDEMIAAGRLRPGSLTETILRKIERRLLLGAHTVISLTEAAVEYLKRDEGLWNVRFAVIPTCVDIDRFQSPPATSVVKTEDSFIVGSVGTVASGWFLTDWLMRFFLAVQDRARDAQLRIVTLDSPDVIETAAARHDVSVERIAVVTRKPVEIPAELRDMKAGALFYASGAASIGRAPTRMGEFLASGVPCVTNRGVGDVANLIERYGVGVVIENDSAAAMREAADRLLTLRRDPELSARCRHAAQDYFSVDRGVAIYDGVYRDVSTSARRESAT